MHTSVPKRLLEYELFYYLQVDDVSRFVVHLLQGN